MDIIVENMYNASASNFNTKIWTLDKVKRQFFLLQLSTLSTGEANIARSSV